MSNKDTSEITKATTRQVRRLSGNKSAKADVRQALQRFRPLRAMMIEAADRHAVPYELLALPFVESRYRNLDEIENRLRCCAGMWQLDRGTARSLGLRVDRSVDERLDVPKATDAALRHLAELHGEFGDWNSAVAAYNIGKTRLRRIMRETQETDARVLAKRKYIGQFVIKVAAASVIMRADLPASRPAPGVAQARLTRTSTLGSLPLLSSIN